jgi:hypothetical protein
LLGPGLGLLGNGLVLGYLMYRSVLVPRAMAVEQAERISRSMVEVQVVDGALLLDGDPTWAGRRSW